MPLSNIIKHSGFLPFYQYLWANYMIISLILANIDARVDIRKLSRFDLKHVIYCLSILQCYLFTSSTHPRHYLVVHACFSVLHTHIFTIISLEISVVNLAKFIGCLYFTAHDCKEEWNYKNNKINAFCARSQLNLKLSISQPREAWVLTRIKWESLKPYGPSQDTIVLKSKMQRHSRRFRKHDTCNGFSGPTNWTKLKIQLLSQA